MAQLDSEGAPTTAASLLAACLRRAARLSACSAAFPDISASLAACLIRIASDQLAESAFLLAMFKTVMGLDTIVLHTC